MEGRDALESVEGEGVSKGVGSDDDVGTATEPGAEICLAFFFFLDIHGVPCNS